MVNDSEFNCTKCNLKDTERMVQCDACDNWYHFECAGVNSDVANVSWSCENCGQQQSALLTNTTTTHTSPIINATTEFMDGLELNNAQHINQQTKQPEVPGASTGAYKKVPAKSVDDLDPLKRPTNVEKLLLRTSTPGNMADNLLKNNVQLRQQNCPKSTDVNLTDSSNNNFTNQRELQLQFLEEERELQRQYLEKKYKILSQNNANCGLSTNSLSNTFSTFQPTTSQIAARQVIPKDLPAFDGNPEDWPLFISNYKNSTQLAGYTDGENLMRLQSCLRGKAKELVRCKLLLPSMVNEIIETLEMCFGRPEHILDSMIEKAVKIPPLKDKLDSLIEYALIVRNICSTMEACNMTAHLNNPMLVKTLLDKLPNNHKLSWALHTKNDKVPVVKAFSDWIYAIAAAASQVVSPVCSSKRAASLNTHQENNSEKICCVFCKDSSHKIQSCDEFKNLSLDHKWSVVKENKLCRQCLNLHRRKCYINKNCGIDGCTAKHHQLMHKYAFLNNSTTAVFSGDEQTENVNTHNDNKLHKPCFRILPIRINHDNKSLDTFALLDEGSSVTLMEQHIFDKMSLKGKKEPLELRWTGNITRSEEASVKLNLNVSNIQNNNRYTLYNVQTVSDLDLSPQSLNMDEILEQNPYLKGLPIKSYTNVKPTILIGLNNVRVSVPLKIREGRWNQPIATKTRLGWTLYGYGIGNGPASLNIHRCECEKLHEEVKEYFGLESPPEKTILSAENEKAIKILQNTSVKKGGQFEVGLLWKNENQQLPESYEAANHRMKCLQKKFRKDPLLQQTMQAEIDKLIAKGYAEKIDANKIHSNLGRVWYLPIFVALNPNKPNKVRLVWDAASKSHGKSLNDFLMSGPDLLTSLFDILIEFRVGQIAICGDIAEMFHRINVNNDDMHVQRFLWYDNETSQQPSVYVMRALTFGMCCAPCIAHFIRDKNADEFSITHPRAVKAIKKYHYMDDFIDSVDSEAEALELAVQVKNIHSAAGFHMRNWATNSKFVREQLCEEGPGIQNSFGSIEKILGMYWESNNDVFQYNFRFARLRRDVFQSQVVPTKREVLQVLMAIFDPLGFLSLYTIGLKILLQDVWRSGIKWDDELTEELFKNWRSWLFNITKISSIVIPRCYSPLLKSSTNIQLHTFVDAGESAYSAVCYFRIQRSEDIDISIVAAKSKVSPLKPVSIPRLELQAALVGVRLATKIMKATRISCDSSFWWTDSKTVLKWLSMDPRNLKPFVMHRVGEILETTNVTQWKWVPSKLNPADFATKITTVDENIWFSGPTFLKDDETKWPKCSDMDVTDNSEVRNHVLHIDTTHTNLKINIKDFSCWRALYRATSQFVLYVHILQAIVRKNKRPCLSFEMIQTAKHTLIKHAQQCDFANEIFCLKNNKEIEKSSKLKPLNVYLDNFGILRARGRAETLNCNNPIILSSTHYISFLIVRFHHENSHHCLHESTINQIKSMYHIPKLRVLYKQVRRECQRCKNNSASPQVPQMAVLPPARLGSFERAFTFVGIDFFGPIQVAVGRRREKRWGVLFTCLTVRAIHIEIAHSLDTSSCIMCIQNFISRRGTPREIYTDNGTNFKSVEKMFREEQKTLNLNAFANKYDEIQWRFNPPAAPHMGGAWERLIRSVKTILHAMCPAFNFNDETLRCALWEIEFIINSRPLTFVALDAPEDDALTPNHLLLGSPTGYKPLCEQDYDLRYRWHQTQKFANQFWKRWVREYGPSLVRRTKWFAKRPPISLGDIVIIVDDNLPRNNWPKGIIIDTVLAKDGQVRRVKVKTSNTILERPASKIAVLDVGNGTKSKLNDSRFAYKGGNVTATTVV